MNYNLKHGKRKRGEKQLSSIDLFEKRIVYLDGEIDDDSAKDIIKKLLKLDLHNHNDITMYINSPGGSVSSGLAIFDVMNMIKSKVSTICVGRCASMSCVLLVNGAKGKRYILPNAEIMIHEVSAMNYGKVTEMQEKLEHSKSLNHRLWKIIANKTKKSYKDIKREATMKDKWYSAQEALKYGFVDRVLN